MEGSIFPLVAQRCKGCMLGIPTNGPCQPLHKGRSRREAKRSQLADIGTAPARASWRQPAGLDLLGSPENLGHGLGDRADGALFLRPDMVDARWAGKHGHPRFHEVIDVEESAGLVA